MSFSEATNISDAFVVCEAWLLSHRNIYITYLSGHHQVPSQQAHLRGDVIVRSEIAISCSI